MALVTFRQTKDGDLAARVAHLTFALVPTRNGELQMMSRYPAKNPEDCDRADFSPGGHAATDEANFRREVEEFALHHHEKSMLGRQAAPNASTPWGPSQTATCYYEGIISYSTAGHGGFYVASDLNELIDAAWRERDGWYEEDEMWAVVAFTFPHLFTQFELKLANNTLKNSFPDAWQRLTGTVLQPGESFELDRRAFMQANGGRWMVRSAVMSKKHQGMVIATATLDLAAPDRNARHYLIPDDIYSQHSRGRGRYAFIIDESRDRRVTEHEEPYN